MDIPVKCLSSHWWHSVMLISDWRKWSNKHVNTSEAPPGGGPIGDHTLFQLAAMLPITTCAGKVCPLIPSVTIHEAASGWSIIVSPGRWPCLKP